MKNILGLFLLVVFPLSAMALETKLVSITSDIDHDTTVFYIETHDDGTLDSMRFVTSDRVGRISSDESHPVEQVIQDGGVVVMERDGRQIVRLKVADFTAAEGGEVKVDYLYSGVSNTRRFLRLNLKKDAPFSLLTPDGTVVTKLKVLGNWSNFFGLIGIRDIRVNALTRHHH